MLLCGRFVLAYDNTQLLLDAQGGDREAQYTLAHLMLKGRGGMELDVSAAISWFEKSADNGHRDACFDLAMLYLKGDKVEKNGGKALSWINRAAKLGHMAALYYLALSYQGINAEKAACWLKKAAEAGHKKARQELDLLPESESLQCY